MIQDFSDAIHYILNLSLDAQLRLFWFFVMFDFPRYILTDVYIYLVERLRPFFVSQAREKAFASFLTMNPPLVSVVVPALNEQDSIAWTVMSLKEQTYKNLEIIVVDDGSTDATPQVCRRLSRLEGVRYFRFEERAGKSAALNYGLKHARGRYVVFVDSDASFDRDAIFELIMAFADPKVGAVSGNLMARNRRTNLLTALQHIEYLFTISVGRRIRAHFGMLPVISGAFGAFIKDVVDIDSLGGHEPGPGNDSDLTIRVRKIGYRIAFAPRAICLTDVPENFPHFIKQRWRWDRNIVKNRLRKHDDVFNPFNANFRLKDALSFYDTLFFHLVLGMITIIYLADMYTNYRGIFFLIVLLNYLIYFVSECLELLIVAAFSGKASDLLLIVYLPLYNPYKIFLKLFRITGYLQELLLYYSYRDRFAPLKVRLRMIRW